MLKHKKRANRFAAARSIEVEDGSHARLESEYPTRLNMYLQPPPSEVTIEEFEMFALDRLHVLRFIEDMTLRNKKGAELKMEMDNILDKYLPMKSNFSNSPDLYQERRKDHISHFVLRMAYSRSEELHEWFIRQELALFRYRFDQEPLEQKKKFLSSLNFNWDTVKEEEKAELRKELTVCSLWLTSRLGNTSINAFIENETFFKVDFAKVPDLVRSRYVFVKAGKAYVPMLEQVSLVLREYKRHLEDSLKSVARVLGRVEEDSRLTPILLNIEKQYTGNNYGAERKGSSDDVFADDVEMLVQQHAPLCMRYIQDSMTREKHLKHGGRLQYGLFLKAIGLPVDQALLFWRREFSTITDDKFQKNYAYNIRYNYGLEGKRVNYTAYSCMKIITSNSPSTGDHHGCPFRHFGQPNLEALLYKDGLTQVQVSEISQLAKDKHYQLACTRHFEAKHPQVKGIDTIQHPNQYYDASKNLEKERTEAESMEVDL